MPCPALVPATPIGARLFIGIRGCLTHVGAEERPPEIAALLDTIGPISTPPSS
jgi:hypothetical protein